MKARTALTALLLALCCTARADDTDRERERLAVYARQGDSQLAEASRKMGELYRKTGNGKVRADWIALLVRRGDRRQALAACPECRPGDYAPDELENLAKAALDEKQFDTALQLYQALQKSDPERKIGWLGGALTALDGNDYISAINQIALYRERFGNDADIAAAQSYMDNRIQNNETAVPSRKRRTRPHPAAIPRRRRTPRLCRTRATHLPPRQIFLRQRPPVAAPRQTGRRTTPRPCRRRPQTVGTSLRRTEQDSA